MIKTLQEIQDAYLWLQLYDIQVYFKGQERNVLGARPTVIKMGNMGEFPMRSWETAVELRDSLIGTKYLLDYAAMVESELRKFVTTGTGNIISFDKFMETYVDE